MRQLIEQELKIPVSVPADPQIVGALGAAIQPRIFIAYDIQI